MSENIKARTLREAFIVTLDACRVADTNLAAKLPAEVAPTYNGILPLVISAMGVTAKAEVLLGENIFGYKYDGGEAGKIKGDFFYDDIESLIVTDQGGQPMYIVNIDYKRSELENFLEKVLKYKVVM